MLNQVVLIGRTARDMELKTSATGRPFGILTLAITRPFKNSESGTYETDFVDVSIWGQTAVNVAKYAGKGSAVSVTGRVVNRVFDFPGEKTMRGVAIIGQQVSFITTKAPELVAINDEIKQATQVTANDPTLEDEVLPSPDAFSAMLADSENTETNQGGVNETEVSA